MSQPFPLISMQALKRAGLFDADSQRSSGEEPFVSVELPGLKATAQLGEDGRLLLHAIVGDQVLMQPVGLHGSKLEFGFRRYFICPVCSERSIFLTAMKKRFGCLQCALLFTECHLIAQHKADIVKAKQALRDWRPNSTGHLMIKDGSNFTPPRSIDAERIARLMSTEVAIDAGKGAGQYDILARYFDQDIGPGRTLERRGFVRASKWAPTTDFPRLDLKVLFRRFPEWRGEVLAQTLCWVDQNGNRHEPLMIFDGRGFEPFIAIAHNWQNIDEPEWQFIELVRHINGRYRFSCPLIARRCDILYLRNGFFAHPEVQRIKQPSQFEDRHKRNARN